MKDDVLDLFLSHFSIQLEEDGENPAHSDFYNWLRSNEFELTEQSRAELWQRRYECMRIPESLPRWLKCVKWSNRDDILQVNQMMTILLFLLHDCPSRRTK